MLPRILRLLGLRRRRVSTRLTPKYEARRTRELRAARERFQQGIHA
jgi:hypothetical protein